MSTMNEKMKHANVSPEPIFRMFTAYWLTQILCTAIEHDFFSAIDRGNHTTTEIAAAAKTSIRGTEMLLDALVGLELLSKKDSKYYLHPLSETFLVPGKPFYFGDLRFATVNIPKKGWSKLSEAVKTGMPVGILSPEDVESKIWEKMALGVAPVVYPVAERMCELLSIGEKWNNISVLDIGGGSGTIGLVVAQRDAKAHITQIEWKNVNELAKKLVTEKGVGDQFFFISGDFHQIDFGSEKYDLVILSHLCHQESPSSNAKLMRRIFTALKQGGALVINDFVPNDSRNEPAFPLLFSLNMLVHTKEGKTYSTSQYFKWLKEAGFEAHQRHDLPGISTLLIGWKS